MAGTYLDASADLAQYGGLLEQLNLEAGAPKRQRGREAADPGSDYDDSHVREHLRSCASPAYAGVQGSLSYRSFRSKAFRGGRRPSRCCADCEGRGQRRRRLAGGPSEGEVAARSWRRWELIPRLNQSYA